MSNDTAEAARECSECIKLAAKLSASESEFAKSHDRLVRRAEQAEQDLLDEETRKRACARQRDAAEARAEAAEKALEANRRTLHVRPLFIRQRLAQPVEPVPPRVTEEDFKKLQAVSAAIAETGARNAELREEMGLDIPAQPASEATIPLRTGRHENEARRSLGEVSRHGPDCGPSHGCVEVTRAQDALAHALAERDALRAELAAMTQERDEARERLARSEEVLVRADVKSEPSVSGKETSK